MAPIVPYKKTLLAPKASLEKYVAFVFVGSSHGPFGGLGRGPRSTAWILGASSRLASDLEPPTFDAYDMVILALAIRISIHLSAPAVSESYIPAFKLPPSFCQS